MNRQFTNEEKAKIYNQLLFQYQRLQEKVRLIKADSLDLSAKQLHEIAELEKQMKKIFNDTQRLY